MSIEKIKNVSDQILNRLQSVKGKGEGATRQALILPMIEALGYDIWNPSEVCPEYEADFAIKKSGQKEKVDIAILMNNSPRIYIEIKPVDDILDGHEGQLARYFNSTASVVLGILTNGIEWRFFTDTGDPNIMDNQPFHVTRLDSIDQGFDVFVKFSKLSFNADSIKDLATELLYTAKIANFLRQELDLKDKDISDYFIRWILKSENMYSGIVVTNVVEKFKPIAKTALTRVIREIVRRSISAMENEAAQWDIKPEQNQVIEPIESETKKTEIEKCKIITTEQELQIFSIVKEIFTQSAFSHSFIYDPGQRKEVPITLSYKDTTGYFGIYFNKPSWWVIRVLVEAKSKWIGFNIDDEIGNKLIPVGMNRLEKTAHSNFRIAINKPEDIYKLDQLILAAFQNILNQYNTTE